MIKLASSKLTNKQNFNANNIDHVFAVLSQRLCIEPVIVGSEAIALADRSVAHHMRLLTGVSDNGQTFYTSSPSEPVLVLGAVDLLYNTEDAGRLNKVLNTFSQHLCSAGLVEKGLIGELSARVLLLLARDFAAPVVGLGRDLLEPVSLMTVIDTLFGWEGSTEEQEDRKGLRAAFSNAHVNFTHWIITKDPLPEVPDE
jgi:hypothetical protein